jgi:hypothetical protein
LPKPTHQLADLPQRQGPAEGAQHQEPAQARHQGDEGGAGDGHHGGPEGQREDQPGHGLEIGRNRQQSQESQRYHELKRQHGAAATARPGVRPAQLFS